MSPPDDAAEQAPDPEPEGHPNKANPDKIPERRNGFVVFAMAVHAPFASFLSRTSSNLRLFVLSSLGGFLMGWGGFYYNNHRAPPWIAASLFMSGGILAALGLRQGIINFENSRPKKSRSIANTSCGVLLGLNLLLTVVGLFFEYKPPRRPHLKLLLKSEYTPQAIGELTNEFFVPKDLGATSFSSPAHVWVLVPTNALHVVLQFALENDSPLNAEDLEILLGMYKTTACLLDSGWEKDGRVFSGDFAHWGLRTPRSILPGDRLNLPELDIRVLQTGPDGKWVKSFPLTFAIRAKDMPTLFIGFWLEIIRIEEAPKPETGYGTNGVVVGTPLDRTRK